MNLAYLTDIIILLAAAMMLVPMSRFVKTAYLQIVVTGVMTLNKNGACAGAKYQPYISSSRAAKYSPAITSW